MYESPMDYPNGFVWALAIIGHSIIRRDYPWYYNFTTGKLVDERHIKNAKSFDFSEILPLNHLTLLPRNSIDLHLS